MIKGLSTTFIYANLNSCLLIERERLREKEAKKKKRFKRCQKEIESVRATYGKIQRGEERERDTHREIQADK